MSFTPQVITGTSADGEYIYYNATVVNNSVSTDQRLLDPELVFQDTRQNPIIRDSSKYVMSVDGFKLDGPQKNFPLWIPQIQPGVNLPLSLRVTATSGTGLVQTYTTSTAHGAVAGDYVTITGASPTAGYNAVVAQISATPTPTTFEIAGPENGPSSTAVVTFLGSTRGTVPDVDVSIYTVTFAVFLQGLTGGVPDPTSGIQNGTWVSCTVPLSWIPENYLRNTAPRPRTATPRQEETSYYYGYSYDHFVNLLNNALSTAWRDVIYKATQVWGALGTPVGAPGTVCPFFEYDPTTGLFALCQDAQTSYLPYGTPARSDTQVYSASQGVSDALCPFTEFGPSTAAGYQVGEFSYVGMNSNLEGLMTNFDTFYYGYNNGIIRNTSGGIAQGYSYTENNSTAFPPATVDPLFTSGTVYLPEFYFNVVPQPSQPDSVFVLGPPYKDPTNAATPVYIRDIQNYKSTGSLWSPIASIVLVTGTLPVRFEYTASPVELGTGNVGGTTATSGASQRVLLEVALDELTADGWRGALNYKPQVPLFSALDPVHDGITNLDVRVCWRSRLTNSLIPVKMYNSSNFTMRLRFVRKS